MIVLQAVIERITHTTLDTFVMRDVFAPLGMRDTRFTPNLADAALRRRIVATENDPARGGLLRGTVDDQNAWAWVASRDTPGCLRRRAISRCSPRCCSTVAPTRKNRSCSGNRGAVDGATIGALESRARMGHPGTRASSGRYSSPRSFGHTGYTGASLWLDPERGIFVVLLMNRVNSRGTTEAHLQVRRDMMDAVQIRDSRRAPDRVGEASDADAGRLGPLMPFTPQI